MKKLLKWFAIAFGACVVLGIIASLANNGKSVTATPTPAANTEAKLAPTAAPKTEAVQPTATPASTATAEPTATPAPTNTAEPTAAPLAVKGNGKQASPKISLPAGLAIFHLQYSGQRNFIVELLDDQANTVDLVVNTIGSFSGSKALGIGRAGTYLFNVDASGPWTITIEQPRASAASPAAPYSFSGKGAQASSLIAMKRGLATFKLAHDGKRNFIAELLDVDGSVVDLLVNVIGPFDGSQAVRVPSDGYYLVNVEADGNWTVNVD